ncbi:M24 family metallopeptidase [Ruminococcaceae bacterium OttesenSCG-928-O06]|nr:M24 family metallopeptidase [Ruminococcaceae bacterium OttesenSCG-928-O06]
MNYIGRIQRAREKMAAAGAAALCIANDAGWEYMAGLPRSGHGNTKNRQNSQEFACLLLTETRVVALSPRLSAIGFYDKMDRFPAVDELVSYPDEDLTGAGFDAVLRAAGLLGKTVAVTRDIPATMVLRLQALGCNVINMSREIDLMRAVKDEEEIALMRTASRIADDIYADMMCHVKPGMAIREIEHAIERRLEDYGAAYTSFPAEVLCHGPEAGVGVGACHPQLEVGYTLAYDYGVVYQGYCSDFGRTVFLQEPDAEMRHIHEVVMAAQKAGMEAMKAGRATGADCNRAARQVVEDAGYGEYFIHRLGHGIGKDVHEHPFLAEGEDTVLQANMCFTAEPSIYIPHKCLVRVEDVVLVTEDGYDCLNKVTKDIVVV